MCNAVQKPTGQSNTKISAWSSNLHGEQPTGIQKDFEKGPSRDAVEGPSHCGVGAQFSNSLLFTMRMLKAPLFKLCHPHVLTVILPGICLGTFAYDQKNHDLGNSGRKLLASKAAPTVKAPESYGDQGIHLIQHDYNDINEELLKTCEALNGIEAPFKAKNRDLKAEEIKMNEWVTFTASRRTGACFTETYRVFDDSELDQLEGKLKNRISSQPRKLMESRALLKQLSAIKRDPAIKQRNERIRRQVKELINIINASLKTADNEKNGCKFSPYKMRLFGDIRLAKYDATKTTDKDVNFKYQCVTHVDANPEMGGLVRAVIPVKNADLGGILAAFNTQRMTEYSEKDCQVTLKNGKKRYMKVGSSVVYEQLSNEDLKTLGMDAPPEFKTLEDKQKYIAKQINGYATSIGEKTYYGYQYQKIPRSNIAMSRLGVEQASGRTAGALTEQGPRFTEQASGRTAGAYHSRKALAHLQNKLPIMADVKEAVPGKNFVLIPNKELLQANPRWFDQVIKPGAWHIVSPIEEGVRYRLIFDMHLLKESRQGCKYKFLTGDGNKVAKSTRNRSQRGKDSSSMKFVSAYDPSCPCDTSSSQRKSELISL